MPAQQKKPQFIHGQPSMGLPFEKELVVDLFAGGGGASTGIARAYREPDVAVNHNPGMGPRTVAEFVADCGWDYVLNCLDRDISSTVFSGDALHTLAKKCIVQRRRQQTGRHDWELGELSKGEACKLWHDIDVLSSIETPNETWHHDKILTELFGDEWHYLLSDKANEPNHEFTYLRRVVEAVQQALRQEQQQVAACGASTSAGQ